VGRSNDSSLHVPLRVAVSDVNDPFGRVKVG
jgi:hypothetical protein